MEYLWGQLLHLLGVSVPFCTGVPHGKVIGVYFGTKRTLHCGTADILSEGDMGLPNTGCGHNPIFNTFSHTHPHTHTLPLANQTNDAMQHAVG